MNQCIQHPLSIWITAKMVHPPLTCSLGYFGHSYKYGLTQFTNQLLVLMILWFYKNNHENISSKKIVCICTY
jgi:hypothetical protein